MDIGFFLNYNNEIVQLPMNPSELEVSTEADHKYMDIISLGEVSVLNNRKLKSISFDSFFPAHPFLSSVRTKGEFKGPDFYKKFIEKIIGDKKPVRLIITGIGITMDVSIDKFSFKHVGGEHEDAYYTLSLREYRNYGIIKIPVAEKTANTRPTASSKAPPPTKITIGCNIICNGTVMFSSYGATPTLALKNFRGKISHINMKGAFPYHVVTPDGRNRGWSKIGNLKLV